MKVGILITATIMILLIFLSWHLLFGSKANNEPSRSGQINQNVNQANPNANLMDWNEYQNLLFFDHSLEEVVKRYNAPNDLFLQAYRYVNEGKREEAKKSLKQVLADPTTEVRTRLWVWRALRDLGERPPAKINSEVQGVVLEVPVDSWVDTLAAYSDGRARYLNGRGRALVWEIPEETHLTPLIMSVIDSAKPLVTKTPAREQHQPAKEGVIRASILTYGGVHILEAKESDLMNNRKHEMAPVYEAGTRLFLALVAESEKSGHER